MGNIEPGTYPELWMRRGREESWHEATGGRPTDAEGSAGAPKKCGWCDKPVEPGSPHIACQADAYGVRTAGVPQEPTE